MRYLISYEIKVKENLFKCSYNMFLFNILEILNTKKNLSYMLKLPTNQNASKTSNQLQIFECHSFGFDSMVATFDDFKSSFTAITIGDITTFNCEITEQLHLSCVTIKS